AAAHAGPGRSDVAAGGRGAGVRTAGAARAGGPRAGAGDRGAGCAGHAAVPVAQAGRTAGRLAGRAPWLADRRGVARRTRVLAWARVLDRAVPAHGGAGDRGG